MKRSLGPPGAPDVLQKLGRPGFPKGMSVLLVGGADHERVKIEKQMSKLYYRVTSCGTCDEARKHLTSGAAGNYDIILAEADLFSKASSDGQLLLEAAGRLPLVLVSTPGTTPECVWRGIEVGAAEVLEKPLSQLKLQNIWQHVVRKVMDGQEILTSRTGLFNIGEGSPCQVLSSAPSSKRTLSSSMSAVTAAPCQVGDSLVADHEGSVSGSLGKDGSADNSISNNSPESSHTVDGPAGRVAHVSTDSKPVKKAKIAKACNGTAPNHMQQPILRSQSVQPIPASSNTTVVGMVHPSWASSQGLNQAFRGSIPPGCVWGTPLNPPPGWQGMFPNGSGPLLGSAAASATNPFLRCHSAPVTKVAPSNGGLDDTEGFPELDPALMVNLTDDLFLGDDFLDCGDNYLGSLGSSCHSNVPPEPLLEMPPIGLTLRKSESLVNLINHHLGQVKIEQQATAARG